jgi:ribosomal protein L37AE/L43A
MSKKKHTTPFDSVGYAAIAHAKKQPFVDHHWKRHGKLFCESCQQTKPKNNTPARKGWKCDDCEKGGK